MLEYVAEKPSLGDKSKVFSRIRAYTAIDTEWEEMLKQIRFIWYGLDGGWIHKKYRPKHG